MSRSFGIECSVGCRSQQHGAQIMAAIVRGSEAEAIGYMKSVCHRCHLVTDASGKSALHTAASCGKRTIVRWLLAQGVVLNQKDLESGYTPLHRALFYGHVHVAVALIKAGANLSALDFDALTPLDHINFDRPPVVSFAFSLPKHVYVWGNNSNFNLGQSHQRARTTPEWLEFLHREGQVITDVALNKFHTLFLATSGRVYACGLGHGGRLGLDITSPVVTPRPVKGLLQCNIVKVATGPDHSIFLTDTGQVWTCGTNSYHQLGLNPPSETVYTPRLLSWHKNHREEVIVGIGAARYHSVIWTTRVLYTFGLNAGQLGHFKSENERTIISPRSVTSIVLREEGTLACVGVGDAATVVSTSFGDVYVLHQYQTRKVASKMLGVVKVACVGGHLDSRIGADGLTEKGGTALKIGVLVGGSIGHLYLWTKETAHLSRCLFTINRKINLIDFCLNTNSLCIVSDEGEAFSAIALPPRERKPTDKVLTKTWGPLRKFNDFIDRSACIMLRLTRIAALHRTVAIMCDPKGRNFAALQNDPNSFLLEVPQVSPSTIGKDLLNLFLETNEEDSIHDVVIQCGGRNFPAHSYVLAHHSKYFRDLLVVDKEEEDATDDNSINVQKVCSNLHDSPEKKCLIVNNVKLEILQEIITYIYSGSCQLTTLGRCQFKPLAEAEDLVNVNINHSSESMSSVTMPYHINPKQSAYVVYKEERLHMKNANKKKKKGQNKTEIKNEHGSSATRPLEINNAGSYRKPLQLLLAAAKKLGITSLIREVEKLEVVDGYIQLKYGYNQRDIVANKAPRYNREMHQDLWDVMIQSKSGDVLGAHKCMLAARLEYFHCMFSASWMEALSSKSLSMPLPTSMLTILLDYLYEDHSPKLHHSKDIEFLCNVLVMGDQFLMSRFKEICEVAIAGLLTLKNAGELLEFAVNYNSSQLKTTTMQFISLNLAAMLENGSLLSVSSDVLVDLSHYYRQFIPLMSCRILTPFEEHPYADELAQLLEENPITLPDSEEEWEDAAVGKGDKQQSSARKKKRYRRTSLGDSRTRKTSTSSQLSVSSSSDCDLVKDLEDEFESMNFDDLEERDPKEQLQKREEEVERNSLSLELMEPLKTDSEIKSGIKPQQPQVTKSISWQKVGKKKSTAGHQTSPTPSESPRESPLRENVALSEAPESPKVIGEALSLRLDSVSQPSNKSASSFETPVGSSFPSLSDSFTKAPKTVHQTKNNKIGKLSQKQRKKQAQEAAEAATATAEEQTKTTKIVAPTSPWGMPTAVWGTNNHTATEESNEKRKSHTLADIIKAEEAAVKAKQSSSPPINIQKPKKTYGLGTSTASITPTKRSWVMGETPPSGHRGKEGEGGGAWSVGATSPLSSPANISVSSPGPNMLQLKDVATPSFSKILLEEETYMGNLIRERCKPLSLIQLEDKAIEELYAFYGANECFEEKIEVTRVRPAMANPTWKKS